ncbi:unnamed protein product [Caenorhabditis bovis]|uniref:Uncharacterized protein n=1 Tax=Caenorhabditis bovis TaxID=2654633 RepID=A0A8S1FAY9_9PELO|nr:unnamed protein product [Caenorhabditis bovis]
MEDHAQMIFEIYSLRFPSTSDLIASGLIAKAKLLLSQKYVKFDSHFLHWHAPCAIHVFQIMSANASQISALFELNCIHHIFQAALHKSIAVSRKALTTIGNLLKSQAFVEAITELEVFRVTYEALQNCSLLKHPVEIARVIEGLARISSQLMPLHVQYLLNIIDYYFRNIQSVCDSAYPTLINAMDIIFRERTDYHSVYYKHLYANKYSGLFKVLPSNDAKVMLAIFIANLVDDFTLYHHFFKTIDFHFCVLSCFNSEDVGACLIAIRFCLHYIASSSVFACHVFESGVLDSIKISDVVERFIKTIQKEYHETYTKMNLEIPDEHMKHLKALIKRVEPYIPERAMKLGVSKSCKVKKGGKPTKKDSRPSGSSRFVQYR